MDVFRDIKKALEQTGKHPVAAKVTGTDPQKMTVDIQIEGESVVRKAVPLRIFTDDDNLGAVIVPRIDSEVMVAYLDGDESRPQVIKVQQWEQVIMRKGPAADPALEIIIGDDNSVALKKSSGFEFTIDEDGKVSIGNAPSHSVAWGDAWLEKFNSHKHPTPTGPSGPPMIPLVDEDVNSQIFKVE